MATSCQPWCGVCWRKRGSPRRARAISSVTRQRVSCSRAGPTFATSRRFSGTRAFRRLKFTRTYRSASCAPCTPHAPRAVLAHADRPEPGCFGCSSECSARGHTRVPPRTRPRHRRPRPPLGPDRLSAVLPRDPLAPFRRSGSRAGGHARLRPHALSPRGHRPPGRNTPIFLLPHLLAFRYNDGQFFDKLSSYLPSRAGARDTRKPVRRTARARKPLKTQGASTPRDNTVSDDREGIESTTANWGGLSAGIRLGTSLA